MAFKVNVVQYDPEWPLKFEAEAENLRKILGDNLVEIFHIGSTSVPGLPAKPIIDMMPVVFSLEGVDEIIPAFEALGYESMGEFGIVGRRYFRKGGDEHRSHHIHIFQFDRPSDVLRHIAFRDYLRTFDNVRQEYGELKMSLAAKYPEDIDGYMDGKDAFIKETERNSLLWFWRKLNKL